MADPTMAVSQAYTVLGLTPSALSDTADPARVVRTAYRKKALRDHPDRGGDREAFHRMTEAYEVLGGGVRTPPPSLADGAGGGGAAAKEKTAFAYASENPERFCHAVGRSMWDTLRLMYTLASSNLPPPDPSSRFVDRSTGADVAARFATISETHACAEHILRAPLASLFHREVQRVMVDGELLHVPLDFETVAFPNVRHKRHVFYVRASPHDVPWGYTHRVHDVQVAHAENPPPPRLCVTIGLRAAEVVAGFDIVLPHFGDGLRFRASGRALIDRLTTTRALDMGQAEGAGLWNWNANKRENVPIRVWIDWMGTHDALIAAQRASPRHPSTVDCLYELTV